MVFLYSSLLIIIIIDPEIQNSVKHNVEHVLLQMMIDSVIRQRYVYFLMQYRL